MKILVVRFSALGDVAMSVPIIDSLARQYPNLEIVVLSRTAMEPVFAHLGENVKFRGVNLNDYKGLFGLYRLFKELNRMRIDYVADLHNVIRTKILRAFFFLSGKKVAVIKKGRGEKKKLTSSNKKELKQLKTSFARYADVFAELGFPVCANFTSIYGNSKADTDIFSSVVAPKINETWIGIAPFAAHAGKILPEKTVVNLIEELAKKENTKLFLFGGGKKEKALMDSWALGHNNVISLAGKLKLDGELALMSHLDVMVSMDSANMHFASLTGTPVVSIWGATHPYAGFLGWNQSEKNIVQLEMTCRPCSIFGNKPCQRGDYACLKNISAEMVLSKIEVILKEKNG